MSRTPGRRLVATALLLHGAVGPLSAQDSLLTELARRFQTEPLRLGMLLQVVGDFQDNRNDGVSNGFRVPNARLKLSGRLDNGFGYLVQTNFASSTVLLDAALSYRAAEVVTLQAGKFKVPFSGELLTAAGELDFIDRAQVVRALAPGRQLGAQAGGRVAHGVVQYGLGVFNGNTGSSNDDDHLLTAGRVAIVPIGNSPSSTRHFEIAGNLAYSHDTDVSLGSLGSSFAGRRTLYGADVRWRHDDWLVAGEFIGARLEPDSGRTTDPVGWQGTLGYHISRKVQLLARWDGLRPDGRAADSDLLLVGFRAWPTGAVQFRLAYQRDLAITDASPHGVLAGAQLGF
jgi:phosphate-selective porin